MEENIYKSFVTILNEELLPAMGCTEPIAVAYAAAYAREVLGTIPEEVDVKVSGNILKNVKGVVVPGTGGMKGIISAVAAGIVAGDAKKELEVISGLTPSDREKISIYMQKTPIIVGKSTSECVFDIAVEVRAGKQQAAVRITGHHTNIVRVVKNGQDLLNRDGGEETSEPSGADRSLLSVENIVKFIKEVDLKDIEGLIERQIAYNTAIAEEGLKNDYGARVGKVLLKAFGEGVDNLAKATAAAGSDARMNGCALPVVIVSGSGNQGMAASLPVIVYARHLNAPREKLLRAVALSDLITIHLKTGIGRLSAYCGAVSAGCGAGAGVCFLYGGDVAEISRTIVNAVAIDSGLICDGAKSSCAAKIASAVEAGLLGMEMAKNDLCFPSGDGILGECVENTIDNVCDVAKNGMRETDEEIIKLMIKSCK